MVNGLMESQEDGDAAAVTPEEVVVTAIPTEVNARPVARKSEVAVRR
jgi:hypothetical protein